MLNARRSSALWGPSIDGVELPAHILGAGMTFCFLSSGLTSARLIPRFAVLSRTQMTSGGFLNNTGIASRGLLQSLLD